MLRQRLLRQLNNGITNLPICRRTIFIALPPETPRLCCTCHTNKTLLRYNNAYKELDALKKTSRYRFRSFITSSRLYLNEDDNEDRKVTRELTDHERFVIEDERAEIIRKSEEVSNRITFDGIPVLVPDEQLEDEVMQIFHLMRAKVNRDDIESVFRLGDSQVHLRFWKKRSKRKVFYKSEFWQGCLIKDLYGGNVVRVNHAICKEMKHIEYWVRKLKKEGKIQKYVVGYDAIMKIRMDGSGSYEQVTHMYDLVQLGLLDDLPEDPRMKKPDLIFKSKDESSWKRSNDVDD